VRGVPTATGACSTETVRRLTIIAPAMLWCETIAELVFPPGRIVSSHTLEEAEEVRSVAYHALRDASPHLSVETVRNPQLPVRSVRCLHVNSGRASAGPAETATGCPILWWPIGGDVQFTPRADKRQSEPRQQSCFGASLASIRLLQQWRRVRRSLLPCMVASFLLALFLAVGVSLASTDCSCAYAAIWNCVVWSVRRRLCGLCARMFVSESARGCDVTRAPLLGARAL
jgi:hypothetical protein